MSAHAKQVLFVLALVLSFAAPSGAWSQTGPCQPEKAETGAPSTDILIRPRTTDPAHQMLPWQRMGREIEIVVEDPSAIATPAPTICIGWQKENASQEVLVQAPVTKVDALSDGQKGLRIVARIPELSGAASVRGGNNTFDVARVKAIYTAAPAQPGAAPGTRIHNTSFGVLRPDVYCDYPFPSLTAGAGSAVASNLKNWMPEGGAAEFTATPGLGKRIPADALVRLCIRWRLSDGDPGPFQPAANVRVVNTTADSIRIAGEIPDIKLPEKPTVEPVHTYAIPHTAVPFADVRVVLFEADGFPLMDVVTPIGITGYKMALALVALVLAVAYLILRVAINTRLKNMRRVGPLLSLITGRGGNASLSQFQIILWTFVVLTSVVYVMALSGELIGITTGTLVLLGISGASGVVAKIKAERPGSSEGDLAPADAAAKAEMAKTKVAAALAEMSKAAPGSAEQQDLAAAHEEAQAKATAAQLMSEAVQLKAAAVQARTNIQSAVDKAQAETEAKAAEKAAADKSSEAILATAKAETLTRARHPQWSDLIMEESLGREIDVARVQMLFFTVVTAFFVLLRVATSFVIPEIPEGFLLLMGISNGVYVGSKFAARPGSA